ncbi:hypothetical protein [Niallia oryzisoli]|uniref:hypothetical protein n=1 Tax=Niallia oryzisoli TaxID=1737571 RepID=UPI0037367187
MKKIRFAYFLYAVEKLVCKLKPDVVPFFHCVSRSKQKIRLNGSFPRPLSSKKLRER